MDDHPVLGSWPGMTRMVLRLRNAGIYHLTQNSDDIAGAVRKAVGPLQTRPNQSLQ